ncbi:hypothetical protein COO60DRAFT_1458256 [Scenedesmus sp. NREL 46B-D3]|nr:hypothetical protein COO60DRAFT_1458256 [Scenedesmus sp. NREL 46B-D3]
MRTVLAPVHLLVLYLAVSSARSFSPQRRQQHSTAARRLQAAEAINFDPLAGVKAVAALHNPLAAVTRLASRAAEGMQLPPMPTPVKPLAGLAQILRHAELALPNVRASNGMMSAPEAAEQVPKATLDGKLAVAVDTLSQSSGSPPSMYSQKSSASAKGFAFNGGKASAHATATAQDAGISAALASAVAVADHTAASLARAASEASNPAQQGMSAALTMSTAVGDKSALVISRGGSLAVGLGGDLSMSETVSNSAGSQGSVAYVGGTAVSSAGPGSSASTTSQAKAAADKGSVAATRADSISLGQLQGSDAQGSATASSQASDKGVAASQSLMESFGIVAGSSGATSAADAAANGGASFVRDKAVGIGLNGAAGQAHTSSSGTAGFLGLTVVDSVVRAITAGNLSACGEAVTKTYADLSTGPQISLDTFILTLQQRAGKACATSFNDQAARQAGKVTEQQASLPTFEGITEVVMQQTEGVLSAASGAVGQGSVSVNFFLGGAGLLPRESRPAAVVEKAVALGAAEDLPTATATADSRQLAETVQMDVHAGGLPADDKSLPVACCLKWVACCTCYAHKK